MKKQKGLGLIGVLLIIGALVITAGGVVVWREKVLPALPSMPIPPTSVLLNPKYLSDESYCEKDSDCTTRPACCNPCYREFVNIYHKDPIPRDQCTKFCPQDCPPPEFFSGNPVCRENKCTSSTSTPRPQVPLSGMVQTMKVIYAINETIKVTITNHTDKTLTLGGGCDPPIGFAVQKFSQGSWQHYRKPLPCKMVAMPPVKVDPGRWVDVSTPAPGEAGKYRLVLNLAGNEPAQEFAYSNEFTVR